MYKTKITETTEKYDKDGKLVEKFIREEITEEDKTHNNTYSPVTCSPSRLSSAGCGVPLKYGLHE